MPNTKPKHPNLPNVETKSDASAYRYLIRKEARVKPALIKFRNEILKHYKLSNYQHEYDRLTDEIDGYANVFSRPGSSHVISKLKSRQADLKKLFREASHPEPHPITKP